MIASTLAALVFVLTACGTARTPAASAKANSNAMPAASASAIGDRNTYDLIAYCDPWFRRGDGAAPVSDSEVYVRLAKALEHDGKVESAKDVCRRVLELSTPAEPSSEVAWCNDLVGAPDVQ